MRNGFKIVEDKYYRGNGRWAKITRLHEKKTDAKGNEIWKAKYSVAYGVEGEVLAISVGHFTRRYLAVFYAKEYIKTGEKTI